MRSRDLSALEKKISHSFRDIGLLITALTHSSYSNDSQGSAQCYERLEFLGDSLLGCITAEFLYLREPELPEGHMTRLRASLVCEASLYAIALRLSLGDYMLLGKGEEYSGGRTRPSILADMVEALIAAVYLDGGMTEAKRLVYELLLNDAEIGESVRTDDYKTELQEFVQREGAVNIDYEELSSTGPDHDKFFTSRVLVNGRELGTGSGRRKKEAEQMAAKAALERIADEPS